MTTRWRWLLSAAAALVLTACGSNSAGQPTPTSPVTIHIQLDQTRVAPGTLINGQAVLSNSTSKSITVEQCARDGWLWVGLANKRIQFKPTVETVYCAPSVHLAPGANRFPVTVMTTYQGCVQPGGRSTTNVPPCIGSSGMPPLPSGTYKTKVVIVGLPSSTQISRSIEITLSPSSTTSHAGLPKAPALNPEALRQQVTSILSQGSVAVLGNGSSGMVASEFNETATRLHGLSYPASARTHADTLVVILRKLANDVMGFAMNHYQDDLRSESVDSGALRHDLGLSPAALGYL